MGFPESCSPYPLAEYIDMNALYAEESMATAEPVSPDVATSTFTSSLPSWRTKYCSRLGHATGTYILESEGRTMEQFQRVDVWFYLYDRAIECQGVIDDFLQVGIHILAEESVCHLIGYLLERVLFDIVEEFLWQLLDDFWHVETVVLPNLLLLPCEDRQFLVLSYLLNNISFFQFFNVSELVYL